MQKLATLINSKLGTFPFELSRQLVMEKLLGSKMINPNLPNYYFSHIEAKVQHAVVQRLKTELDYVKWVSSREKLTCKGTLLKIVVSRKVTGIKALGKLFNTNIMNIYVVIQRQKHVETSGSS